jgi:hypothetical protein
VPSARLLALFSTTLPVPFKTCTNYGIAEMGLNLARCHDHSTFFGWFWQHLDASLIIFLMITFVIPGIVFLLVRTNGFPKDEASQKPSTERGNVCTEGPVDRPAAHGIDYHTSDKGGRSKKPVMRAVKWVGSTILMGSAAFLFTVQILLILFVGYCVGGDVRTYHLVLLCIYATVGAVCVTVGLIVWIITTVTLIADTVPSCCKIKRRAVTRVKDLALGDVRNTKPSGESVTRNGQVTSRGHIEPSTPTLPPYTV